VSSDELLEVFDAEVGERHLAVVTGSIDSDQAVFGFHVDGYVPEPVLIFAEHLGDAGDGEDVMDLIDLHA
jgi:hypothetical protein